MATAVCAGFLKRSAAAFIDLAVTLVASVLVGAPILTVMMLQVVIDVEDPDREALVGVFEGAAWALLILTAWVYHAALESSPLQATLGKLALRVRVTGLDGGRIGFDRATWRFFGKFLSALSLVGFFLAAFTARRQALHDRLAGSLVVERP